MNNAVQDFLSSLGATSGSGNASSARATAFTTLPDLLSSSTTIPMIDAAEESFIDNLLMKELPPALIALEMDPDSSEVEELDQETLEAVVMSLEPEKKRDIVKRVLRSPQFAQSLMSLTGALRDGGVPNVSQALGIQVKNGGYTGPDRRVPLEGGEAMEAFLEGTKDSVKKT
jgi:26S proteasome regulatory subunit N13